MINKNHFLLVVVSLVFFAVVSVVSAATLSITSPGAGTVWDATISHTVIWSSTEIPSDTAMSLRLFPGAGGGVISNVTIPSNSGSYTVAADSIAPGDYYYVLSTLPPSVEARSGNFTVIAGTDNGGSGEGGWQDPPDGIPPENCNGRDDIIGCNPPINVSGRNQTKPASLTLDGLTSLFGISISNNQSYTKPSVLALGVNGRVGATEYCDELGTLETCKRIDQLGGGGGNGFGVFAAVLGNANGQEVSATKPNDTLNFVGGAGIRIDADAPNKRLTFTNIGGAPGGPGGGVSSVGTGAGLTGGPITNSGTVSLNIDLIQNCDNSVGDKIIWNKVQNRLTCAEDTRGTGQTIADNLGNHIADKNINLGGYYMSGTGSDNKGLYFTTGDRVVFPTGISIPYNSPGTGKVLTSDAAGYATWQNPGDASITDERILSALKFNTFAAYEGQGNEIDEYDLGTYRACFVSSVGDDGNLFQSYVCRAKREGQSDIAITEDQGLVGIGAQINSPTMWHMRVRGGQCRVTCIF